MTYFHHCLALTLLLTNIALIDLNKTEEIFQFLKGIAYIEVISKRINPKYIAGNFFDFFFVIIPADLKMQNVRYIDDKN